MGRQNRAHHDTSPSAPHSTFDQIAGNVAGQYCLNATLQTGESRHSDHRLGLQGPAPAYEMESLDNEASPQWPVRGHSLVHPVSGEVAAHQVEVHRTHVAIAHSHYGSDLACQHYWRKSNRLWRRSN